MVVVRHSPKPAPFVVVVVVVVVASLLLAASGGTADAFAPPPPTSVSSPSRALAAADNTAPAAFAARRRPADGIVDIDVDDGEGDGDDVDCDGGVRSSSRHGGGRRGRRQQTSRRGVVRQLLSSAAAAAAAASSSSSLLLPPMAPPAFAASDDGDGTTTKTAPPMRPPPTEPYTRLPSPADKFQFGYSITPPPTFVPSNKPLKTHLDEINFSPPSDAKGYTIGVTVDPVRINSMREFGSPGEVAARVVTAEVNRDGVFEVTLARDPKEDATTGGYDIEYVSDGKRGTKRFVTRVYVKDGYLYVLTVQSKEKDYDGAREAEVSECVGSFRPL
jgi:hypothetical protein